MQEIILYFTIYSILGWICECIYCAAIDKVWVNRGFLNGPVCPVYGFGSMFVILILGNLKGHYIELFISSIILTTALEYLTAVILEKAFNLKWWDYSNYKLNYKGRICVLNSVIFGFLSLFLIEILNPFIVEKVDLLSVQLKSVFAVIIVIIFIIDLVLTIISLIDMNDMLSKINGMFKEFKRFGVNLEKLNDIEFNRAFIKVSNFKDFKNIKSIIEDGYNNFKDFRLKSSIQNRIIKAFPDLKSKEYSDQFKKMKESIQDYWKNKN